MCVRPAGRDCSCMSMLLILKLSTEGDASVPSPHPLHSRPYRTMPPLLAALDIPAVGSIPISKDTTCPATLHETMFVQGNQVGIRSRHYASFALGNASNPGRGTCCHANGLQRSA